MLLTNGESCDILSSDPERDPVGVTINGGGCFLIPEEVNIFLPSSKGGGDRMDFVTWSDLLEIALLVFAIISCFRNNKKR